ncbi:hypothetical protein Tco_0180649 [Tanacetum coccineum]
MSMMSLSSLSETNDMENIIRILNIFYIASGLKINIHKLNAFGVGVSNNEIVSMAACTGFEPGSFSFSYLGLPIGSNMSRIVNWQVLIDHFKARMSGWKANLLSIGGRLTLIEFVLGSLGIYYLSIFKVPKMVVKSLESLRVAFFWGGHEDTKKITWVKWSNILSSLVKGGLGIAIHGDEAGVDLRGYQTNGVWDIIVGTINHLHSSGIVPLNFIRFKVGDGSSIHFWKDTWLGIVNGSWDWDWSRPITMGRTKTEFDNLILGIASLESDENVGSDSCIWNLSNDDNFSVNKVRKHIEECSLPMLSPSTRWDRWKWSLSKDGELTVKELSILIEEKILVSDNGGQETIWNKLVPKKVNIFV